jgi:hypothetical protein
MTNVMSTPKIQAECEGKTKKKINNGNENEKEPLKEKENLIKKKSQSPETETKMFNIVWNQIDNDARGEQYNFSYQMKSISGVSNP